MNITVNIGNSSVVEHILYVLLLYMCMCVYVESMYLEYMYLK